MTLYEYRLGNTQAVGQLLSSKGTIKKKQSNQPNLIQFNALTNSSLLLNDEVKYYDLDNNFIFGGYVQKIVDNAAIQAIQVADYSIILSQLQESEVLEEETPIEFIERIVDTYTDFTFVDETSLTLPDISKRVYKDVWLLDMINDLLQAFNGTFEVSRAKVFTLKLRSSSTSTENLVFGKDQLTGKWTTDILKKAEKVVVIGSNINQRQDETLTGTGTVFTTDRTPEDMEISGLTQTTENINGDYVVDKPNKEVTFNTSKTNPVVNYSYQSQVRVELGEGKTVLLERSYIETKTEARQLAREYKARFGDGAQSSKWTKASSDIDNFTVGDNISVTDYTNDKTGNYVINDVTLELPNKMLISVGETDDDMFDWQKESINRIKELEKKDQNSDFITVDDFLTDTVRVTITTEITKLEGYIDDGTILWASDTTLASNGDLISDADGSGELVLTESGDFLITEGGDNVDTEASDEFAIAYDDSAVPPANYINYL